MEFSDALANMTKIVTFIFDIQVLQYNNLSLYLAKLCLNFQYHFFQDLFSSYLLFSDFWNWYKATLYQF